MHDTDDRGRGLRLATSEDIPRAVEFLILSVFGCGCLAVALVLALLSIAAWLMPWNRWLATALSALALAAVAVGLAIRPRGRFRFDRVGPSIIVPPSEPRRREPEDRA